MATIDDVITWANTLPSWQGDAVRRLLVAGEEPLSDQDYFLRGIERNSWSAAEAANGRRDAGWIG